MEITSNYFKNIMILSSENALIKSVEDWINKWEKYYIHLHINLIRNIISQPIPEFSPNV
jgi:hypothetical protein